MNKFSEWIKIREAAPPSAAMANQAQNIKNPAQIAQKNKTATEIKRARVSALGKPPAAKIDALKKAAKKLEMDPNADPEAIDSVDKEVEKVINSSSPTKVP
jgi:hypothetical protein